MIRICLLCLVLLGCQARARVVVAPPVAPTAAPRVGAVHGTLALGGGLVATHRYDFDRDELRHVVATEHGTIAVTGSGNLLGFDGELTHDRELVVSPPISVLAAGGKGVVFAGLIDGTLTTVDPRTLAVTRIGAVPGTPVWIQQHGDRLIVVAAIGVQRVVHRLSAADPARAEPPIVAPRPSGPGIASVWMIDGANRLWYGADQGEWGGWVGSIDLATGAAIEPIAMDDGVAGMIERGGKMWVYGGMMHMGFTRGVISELRDGIAHVIWPADSNRRAKGTTAVERRLPITRIFEVAGRLHVIVWNELYEVDPQLARWKLVAAVPARFRWGRPDAVGAYPAIEDVLVLPGGDLVLATTRDGLFRIRGGVVEPHAIGDPLDAGFSQIAATSRGLVAQSGHTIYRRVENRWEQQSLPEELAGFFELSLVTAPDRAPYLVIDPDRVSPSPTVTARWDAHGMVVLGRQVGPPAYRVVALGDELWALEHGTIWKWNAPAAQWRRYDHGETGFDVGFRFEPVAAGSGWLIRDLDKRALLRLSVDRSGVPKLTQVLPRELIDDAIAWETGLLLLATARGVVTFDPATRQVRRAAVPVPRDDVRTLARDRDGKLWLATATGLFVVDGEILRPIEIPALLDRTIVDLTADPEGGVVAALGSSGVVQVALDRNANESPADPRP